MSVCGIQLQMLGEYTCVRMLGPSAIHKQKRQALLMGQKVRSLCFNEETKITTVLRAGGYYIVLRIFNDVITNECV